MPSLNSTWLHPNAVFARGSDELACSIDSVKLPEAARSTDSLRRKYHKWDSNEEI